MSKEPTPKNAALNNLAKGAAKALAKREALTSQLAELEAKIAEYAKQMYAQCKESKTPVTQVFDVEGVKFSMNNSRGVARLSMCV